MSDWQIYCRLLGYVVPHWQMFGLSLLGYLLYAGGNVLLADLMQFLLDSLDDAVTTGKGIVAGVAYALFDTSELDRVQFARIAVPVAMVSIACGRASGFFLGNYCMNHVARSLIHTLRCEVFERMLVAPAAHYDAHNQGATDFTGDVQCRAGDGCGHQGLEGCGARGSHRYRAGQLHALPELAAVPGFYCRDSCDRGGCQFCRQAFSPLQQAHTIVYGGMSPRYPPRVSAVIGKFGFSVARPTSGNGFVRPACTTGAQNLKLAFVEGLSTPVIQTLLATALATLVWFALSPGILQGFTAGSLVAFLTAATQLGKTHTAVERNSK